MEVSSDGSRRPLQSGLYSSVEDFVELTHLVCHTYCEWKVNLLFLFHIYASPYVLWCLYMYDGSVVHVTFSGFLTAASKSLPPWACTFPVPNTTSASAR
jgi:hypothetical protein